MVLIDESVHLALLGIATVVNGSLAVYAYRNRREPGALAFAGLMATIAVWVGTYAVSLLTYDPELRLVMENTQWLGGAYAPVALLVFALSYTGHDELLTRRTVAGLAALPTAAVVAMWLNPGGIMYPEYTVRIVDGLALMSIPWGPGFWVFLVYSYGLVAVAAALLVRLVVVSDYLYADQSALLLVGIAAPFVGNVFDLFGPNGLIRGETAPYVFTITGLAFGYALFSRRLLDLVPATRQLGRSAAISQLEDGVVIVDTDRRIVYCNQAAAEILGCDPADAVGTAVETLVAAEAVDFGTEDALAELRRDERVYEVRTSPITDRQDRQIGHTLTLNDVTKRTRREECLAAQRDELARLEELNGVLRGVNQALVSATSREEIERAVTERLAEADRYTSICMADVTTWTGEADRWRVAGTTESTADPPALADGDLEATEADRTKVPIQATGNGAWAVVPVAYGRTVFGAIGLRTDRERVDERERAVLAELGETVGHAINAVENRRLLNADAVLEVTLESTDQAAPLVAGTDPGAGVALAGLIPNVDGDTVAYLRVESGETDSVRERLAERQGTVRDVDAADTLEWQPSGETLLGTLVEFGARVSDLEAADGRMRIDVELASGADLRTLIDHVEGLFPDSRLVAKREREGPVEAATPLEEATLDGLTDRQREAIEAAYRAGYFEWPRESTAEEVAETLAIAAPTLHAHLRKAESSLFADLFADGSGGD